MLWERHVVWTAVAAWALTALSGPALCETARMRDMKKSIELAMVIVKHEKPGRMHLAAFWDGNKYVQCRGDQKGGVRCEAGGSLMQPLLAELLTSEP